MTRRIKAYYRKENIDVRPMLTTPEDVDQLIDTLLADPDGCSMAELHSLDRPLLPSGFPDHELLVGADGNLKVGVLEFMDATGNSVTLGNSEGRGEISYYIGNTATEFPARSEVPVELVRQAVKEFLTSGGQRPTCIEWQVPEIW
ncbi:Imm1 family immunity protein [Kutzneria sp. NPDC052558]|uniref:Imm1 family immunity protein n=1 Tax=Kutzneria sp. NPDC052558 TaxID=3364121 RepID=UPI0037C66B56